jgi:uncharacterized phiE125 gp8 family phage protein
MKWTATRPTTPPLVTFPQMQAQLRIDGVDEQDYITDLIDAATEHAENALATSLIRRNITATFYDENASIHNTNFNQNGTRLYLPHGPVASVTTVTDTNGNALTYRFGASGHAEYITITSVSYTYPITVVYVAGYGTTAATVPADIRMAIRTHVASLWSNRESISEKAMVPVPHSLEQFYQLRRRTTPVL